MSKLRYGTQGDFNYFLSGGTVEPLAGLADYENPTMGEGESITLLDDEDHRLAMFGYVEPIPGLLEVWALVGQRRASPVLLHKTAKRMLDFVIADKQPRRIEAMVQSDQATLCRWIQRLGFTEFGLRRAYGLNGETYTMFERIPTWQQ